DTNIEHMPPNPNTTNPLPHSGAPPQVNSIAEKPMKPHPYSASSTHSPALSTPAAPCSPTTQRRNGKARAPRNAMQRWKTLAALQCRTPRPSMCPGMGREGLGGKTLSQGASSPAHPNRYPHLPSPNKGGRHRHIYWAKD
ncbi:hypothetical protein AMECASPLE_028714, partial [Ameca splendens]